MHKDAVTIMHDEPNMYSGMHYEASEYTTLKDSKACKVTS